MCVGGVLSVCGGGLFVIDMAPNMSGNKIIDQGRHFYLVELALTMADDWLRTGVCV